MDKKQLFGGTLLAAGLTTAAAGNFTIGSQPAGNYVGAYFGGFIGFGINGFYDFSATSGTAYAQALGNECQISAYANVGDSDLAYVVHFDPIPFEVTCDTTATVSWDFTGDIPGGAYIDSFMLLEGPGGTLVFADLNNPVGSVDIAVTAGTTYTVFGTALNSTGISRWSIDIGDSPCEGDLNGDGVVGINDFLQLLANWGESSTCARP